jgi:riboflavin synthase
MFSGIVRGVGTLTRVEPSGDGLRLVLRVPAAFAGREPGSSLAVNGVCLTVVENPDDLLVFDAVGATLLRTLFREARPGDRLNLEDSLRLGDPVDGHLVTGHVDGQGVVRARRPGDGAVFFEIEAPPDLIPQIVPRGSVAVDGVSLTVAGTRGDRFTVSIIPYTLRETILGDYEPGRRVHLETDVLAKYVQGRVIASVLGAPGEGRA